MIRFHGLRVALVCACVFATGCKIGSGQEADTATPVVALAPPPSSANTPPPASLSGSGFATVSWVAPLENVDGSALTDLAGFVVVYGTELDALSKTIRIDNPSIDRYLIDGLTAGTWYFGVKAYSADGEESSLSEPVSKTIR